ncbi:MAG TPA: outer membrane lipoprotein carrier protein LolA [Casimicrobiaceae bacterium]|nr:outer membrane lipoprotein carrier protein LolA [Casimicrobiaceae bacterium]
MAILAFVATSSAGAAGLTLDALMNALRAVPARHATFEETRQMAVLNAPLVRRGTLDYVRPSRLEMRVTAPRPEHLVIEGSRLSVERGGEVTVVDLAAQPMLAAWIESLRATLAGDAASLIAHFDVSLTGTLAAWHLTLVPRDENLRNVIASVDIDGHQGEPTRFAIDGLRGDSTVITIAPSRPS